MLHIFNLFRKGKLLIFKNKNSTIKTESYNIHSNYRRMMKFLIVSIFELKQKNSYLNILMKNEGKLF